MPKYVYDDFKVPYYVNVNDQREVIKAKQHFDKMQKQKEKEFLLYHMKQA